jgi:hypothetical protein
MEPQNGINQSVAMAIAGTSTYGQKTSGSETYPSFQQVKHIYKFIQLIRKEAECSLVSRFTDDWHFDLNHHSGCYWSASDGLLIEARH